MLFLQLKRQGNSTINPKEHEFESQRMHTEYMPRIQCSIKESKNDIFQLKVLLLCTVLGHFCTQHLYISIINNINFTFSHMGHLVMLAFSLTYLNSFSTIGPSYRRHQENTFDFYQKRTVFLCVYVCMCTLRLLQVQTTQNTVPVMEKIFTKASVIEDL